MFYIGDDNVRGGCRGGKDNFNWNDIRSLPYKDREMYLGANSKIGYLDKGGYWRKKDWWTRKDDGGKSLTKEREQEKQRDKERLAKALGETVEVVEEVKQKTLTDYEMKKLFEKNNVSRCVEEEMDKLENDDIRQGVGVVKKVTDKANPFGKETLDKMTHLEGDNFDKQESVKEQKETKKVSLKGMSESELLDYYMNNFGHELLEKKKSRREDSRERKNRSKERKRKDEKREKLYEKEKGSSLIYKYY